MTMLTQQNTGLALEQSISQRYASNAESTSIKLNIY